jgi:K+-sensing histidine kinase KdpD
VDAHPTLQRRERIIAAFRAASAVFGLAQLVLYRPEDAELAARAEAVRPIGVALAVALIGVSGLALVAVRWARTRGALRRAGGLFLAVDVVLVGVLVLVYSFDPQAAPWAVLALLPLEGALRFELAGALATWAVVAPLYLLRDLIVVVRDFSPAVATYRLAVLLVIAVFAGVMARDNGRQRRQLSSLAEAARQLVGRVEPAEVFRVLCREAVGCLGADAAVAYVHDGTGFQAVASWPPEALPAILAQDLAAADDAAPQGWLPGVPRWLPADATRPGRLALGLRVPDGPAHVLVVRPRDGHRLPRFEVDLLVSLAESASLALATSRIVTAEQRTVRRLRYLEALRTRFVATVAHDLRMPLTVFKGVAQLLRERRQDIEPAQIDEMLGSVERQANRLSRLADDLLDAARIDAGKLALHLERCDVADVIAATATDVEEGVVVDVEDGLVITADAARLERVLWNLLSNAEKYGQPPFEVRARREGQRVRIDVRDHGTGLGTEQQERLFEDFAGSDDVASVGLGLAIVWQLVEAHDGRVRYRDAQPGACFTVELPVGGPAETDDETS